MSAAPIVMYAVAGVLALAGIAAIFVIRGAGDGAVYGRRIVATMLFAFAGILGMFAWSMASWGPSA